MGLLVCGGGEDGGWSGKEVERGRRDKGLVE